MREAIVWDRELPAFLLSHTVADFDTWLDAYDPEEGIKKRPRRWSRKKTFISRSEDRKIRSTPWIPDAERRHHESQEET